MEKVAQTRPVLTRVMLAAGMLLALAACLPTNGPAPSLPPAQVRIEPGPVTRLEPSALPDATATPMEPATDTISDIAALAKEVYGGRLIDRIFIPAIQVDSSVVPVGWRIVNQPGTTLVDGEWDSPLAEVGWAISSALPDDDGNILLYGHNNMYTAIFKDLGSLAPGDNIYLFNAQDTWQYKVAQVSILPVLGASEKQIAAYLAYLQPTPAARLTLISCWPPVSNTHRVVVLAYPVTYR